MVIQRIQSLFLLLASVLMGLFCYMPTFNIETQLGNYKLSPLSLESEVLTDNATMADVVDANLISYTWFYFLIGIVITLLIFITIFLFKKLKRQKTVASVSLFLSICYFISVGIYSYLIMQRLEVTNWSFTIYSFMPILSFVFLILAIRGIKKDRKLLSDSFRIR